MDITKFYNISSKVIQTEADRVSALPEKDGKIFNFFLQSAVDQLKETDSYLQKQEDEEIKLSLGLTDNTHDLAIAQAKAAASLQYTVALRDRFLEAYREIMQMQV